jgi:hypothetical protein
MDEEVKTPSEWWEQGFEDGYGNLPRASENIDYRVGYEIGLIEHKNELDTNWGMEGDW